MKRWTNWLLSFERGGRLNALALILYFLAPYLFFVLGTNIWRTALAPSDGAIFGVPTKIYGADLQIWNPYIQTGSFPFKDIGWQASYLPGIIVMRLFPNPFGYNILLLFHYTMSGFFTFLFLRRLDLGHRASLIGGMIFMFSGFLAGHKDHHSMVMAASYMPIVLFLSESFLDSRKIKWLLLASLAFGLSILADYTAVSMYIGMVSCAYLLFRVFNSRDLSVISASGKIRITLFIWLMLYGLGVMVAAIEVLPVFESLKYVTRQQITFDFFASYSFPWWLLPILLLPFIFGTQSPSFYQTQYFGPWNLTEMAGYIGILPLLFAALAFILFRKKNRQIYFWSIVSVLAFVLVLGDSTPFYRLMYEVPIYNLFRASARNWLEVHFAVAVLSSFFIQYLIDDEALTSNIYYRAAIFPSAIIVSALTFVLAIGRIFPAPEKVASLWLQNTRLSSSAVYVPLLIITVSLLLLYLSFRYRGNRHFWFIVGVAIFMDLYSFGHFHDTQYPEYRFFRKEFHEVSMFLKESDPNKDAYRLLTLNTADPEAELFPSLNLLYGFATINAYSPIWLTEYKNLTGFEAYGLGNKYELLSNSRILSILSTKYIITSNPADKIFLQRFLVPTPSSSLQAAIVCCCGNTSALTLSGCCHKINRRPRLQRRDPPPFYRKSVEFSDGIAIYENNNFLPRARFVDRLLVIPSSSMAIHVLWEDSNFDPRTTALVEGYEGNTLLNQGVILGVDYSDASRVKLSIRSGPRSFLVLADSFYPGWKALVDGKETRIYRTNAVSRGILIEGEGNHQVEFRFFPVSLFVGLTISGVTILAIMFLSFFLGSKPGMSILAPNFPN